MDDVQKAESHGMITKESLIDNGIYVGYSPRELYFGTWCSKKNQFYIRAIIKGDSKWTVVQHPEDEEQDMFIPVRMVVAPKETA